MSRMEGRPALAPEERFMANPKTHNAPPAESDCDDLVASMLGRHCAGMSKRAGARELRLALIAKAGEARGAAETIRWLLGSIWVQTCTSWLGVAEFPSSVWRSTPDMQASLTRT